MVDTLNVIDGGQQGCRKCSKPINHSLKIVNIADGVRLNRVKVPHMHALPSDFRQANEARLRGPHVTPGYWRQNELKGTINQRAVLKNRTALVDELYTQPISARVLAIEG